MSSKSPELCDQLIEAIETTKAAFGDETSTLLSSQINSFNHVLHLLQGDKPASGAKSKQNESDRRKARLHFVDVYTCVSPMAFMLCVFATTPTRMAKLDPAITVRKLTAWLDTNPIPKGLIEITKTLCETHSIGCLISSHRPNIGTRTTPTVETPTPTVETSPLQLALECVTEKSSNLKRKCQSVDMTQHEAPNMDAGV
jgi:hypothetical protein